MSPDEFHRWLKEESRRPLVMGVLNVTPDSFSDGGRFAMVEAAVARAREMAAEGADLIDVGGESTRPGSQPVEPEEQLRRVIPVLEAVRREIGIACSIDTASSAVADGAVDVGACMINDVTAGRGDSAMFNLVARRRVAMILMHMKGTPATMQDAPQYRDVVAEVSEFLRERVSAAERAGIERRLLLVDPGIGFGKSIDHNLQLLRRQGDLLRLGCPVVIGTSRKGFIGKIIGVSDPAQRVWGTAATTGWAIANGADMVRVHDVAANVQVVRMMRAILRRD